MASKWLSAVTLHTSWARGESNAFAWAPSGPARQKVNLPRLGRHPRARATHKRQVRVLRPRLHLATHPVMPPSAFSILPSVGVQGLLPSRSEVATACWQRPPRPAGGRHRPRSPARARGGLGVLRMKPDERSGPQPTNERVSRLLGRRPTLHQHHRRVHHAMQSARRGQPRRTPRSGRPFPTTRTSTSPGIGPSNSRARSAIGSRRRAAPAPGCLPGPGSGRSPSTADLKLSYTESTLPRNGSATRSRRPIVDR